MSCNCIAVVGRNEKAGVVFLRVELASGAPRVLSWPPLDALAFSDLLREAVEYADAAGADEVTITYAASGDVLALTLAAAAEVADELVAAAARAGGVRA